MRLLCACAALLVSACLEDAARPGTCIVTDRRECVCDDGGLGWETCFLGFPAVWGPCTCNAQPVADAGPDRTVPYRSTVMLDATASIDMDGPERTYEWMIVSVPAGSTTTLDDIATDRPSFFADLPGEYTFALVVGDGNKTSAAAMTTITAVNNKPVAVVSPGAKMFAGTIFALDGSGSYDANSDPLTYQWTVASAPAESTAVPVSPSDATTQFVPDVQGVYKLALTVDDGRAASAPAIVTLDVFFPLKQVKFMRDAAYSAALDRIVLAGINPNALYLVNPVTGASAAIALSKEPFALSLAPDGLSAVVGHEDLVSLVNLQTKAVTLTKTMSAGTLDLVHGGNGFAYVFPSAGTSNSIQNVPLSASAVTQGDLAPITHAELAPGSLTMYAAPDAFDGIYRYDIVSNSPSLTRGVSSKACGRLWISDDAQRIFTRCGTVYSISNIAAQDMQQIGTLEGITYVQYLAQSSTSNKLLTVSGTKLRIYTSTTLAFEREVTLPQFLINDMAYDGDGEYVFLRADNQSYIVIEGSTGSTMSYGLGTFPL